MFNIRIPEGFPRVKLATAITFDYVNWKGKDSNRHIEEAILFFGVEAIYEKPQWLIKGYCVDKRAPRPFSLEKIRKLKEL